jgi:NAD(P)-dependent dehydrogenase (short-subunit alcohol dehydrogenase family)
LSLYAAELADKVVIVTGGASGIGRAAARCMAAAGAHVVLGDMDVRGGEATAAAVFREGGEVVFVPCDVTVGAQVEALVEAAVQTYGRLDAAFNNARGERHRRPQRGQLDRTPEVVLKGVASRRSCVRCCARAGARRHHRARRRHCG